MSSSTAILRFALWYLNTPQGRKLTRQVLDYMSDNILSDENCKELKSLAERGGPFSQEEAMFISMMAGPDKNGHSFNDEDEWDQSTADSYAEHLHNYLYNYKESAVDIDPSIDPNEQHIGIMAQDLEKVNPACIKELSDGTKTVDTGRLALMNAGTIAELARRLDALEANSGR